MSARWLSILLVLVVVPVARVHSEDELTLAQKLALFQKIRQCTAKVYARIDDRDSQLGSGVAVQRLGDEVVVVTNAHVVQSDKTPGISPEVTLKVWRSTGPRLSAIVLSAIRNPKKNADVAWLLVHDPDRTLKIADRPRELLWDLKLKPGYPLYACGNPHDEEFLVTTGAVRSVEGEFAQEKLIEHTALIEHGSSGGGLFDSTGALIGINSGTFDNVHGIAIKIDGFLDTWNIYEGHVLAGNDWPRPEHGLFGLADVKPGENYNTYPLWNGSIARVLAKGRWTIDPQGRTADARGVTSPAGERVDNRFPYGCLLVRQGDMVQPVNQSYLGTDGRDRPDGLYPGAYTAQLKTGDKDDALQFRINVKDNTGLPGRIHVYVMLNDSGYWLDR
jgi:hypothetical protein